MNRGAAGSSPVGVANIQKPSMPETENVKIHGMDQEKTV